MTPCVKYELGQEVEVYVAYGWRTGTITKIESYMAEDDDMYLQMTVDVHNGEDRYDDVCIRVPVG